MAILAGGRRGRTRGRRPASASIREVCLIGEATPGRSPGTGDRIDREGRRYRVEAVDGGPPAWYLHLRAEAGGRSVV